MDDLASAPLPDGIVLIPRAGGYSSSELIQAQKLVNRRRETEHAQSQVQHLTLQSGVRRVSSTVRGILDDWNNGTDHSLKKLFLTDNRLQGVGLLLAALALGGLLIDAVMKR